MTKSQALKQIGPPVVFETSHTQSSLHWEPKTGSAIHHLAVTLRPYVRCICRHIIRCGHDFSEDIDVRVLKEHEDMLWSLVKLDPRGGYYSSLDMAHAVLDFLRSPAHRQLKDEIMKTSKAHKSHNTLHYDEEPLIAHCAVIAYTCLLYTSDAADD